MQFRQLSVADAWEFTPRVVGDDRGVFLEWLKADVLQTAVGQPVALAQANHSVSRRGVIRGVHFAAVPPGQSKYVYCPSGAVLDIVIDIRVGSPTFGRWEALRLDSVDRRAIYISEGLAHAFMALADNSVVTYLCSTAYNPTREFSVNPLDPVLALPWPDDVEPVLSAKDAEAPSLARAEQMGLLPGYGECLDFYRSMRSPS